MLMGLKTTTLCVRILLRRWNTYETAGIYPLLWLDCPLLWLDLPIIMNRLKKTYWDDCEQSVYKLMTKIYGRVTRNRNRGWIKLGIYETVSLILWNVVKQMTPLRNRETRRQW